MLKVQIVAGLSRQSFVALNDLKERLEEEAAWRKAEEQRKKQKIVAAGKYRRAYRHITGEERTPSPEALTRFMEGVRKGLGDK